MRRPRRASYLVYFVERPVGKYRTLKGSTNNMLEKIALLANFLDLSGMNDLSMTHDDSRDLV